MRRVPAGHRSSWSPTNQDSGLGALVPTCVEVPFVECPLRGVSPTRHWGRRRAAGSLLVRVSAGGRSSYLPRGYFVVPTFSRTFPCIFSCNLSSAGDFQRQRGPRGLVILVIISCTSFHEIFHHEKNRYRVPFCCGTRENVAASGCRKLPPHISPQKAGGYFICPVPAHRQFLLAAAGSGHRQRLTCCTGPRAAFALREAAGNPPFPSQQRARDP